jgi:hypothetical protein
VSERDQLEEALKAYTKEERSKIARVESDIRNLSEEVRTRSTYQDVPCERAYNYDEGRVLETRLDTGKTLHERGMHPHERKRELDLRAADADREDEEDAAE